jgi:hypothetical protein
MGRIFYAISAIFFFLAAVGSHIMPNATAWGLVALALGLAVGGWTPSFRRTLKS